MNELVFQSAATLAGKIRRREVSSRETVLDGIENAPSAFMNLFSGDNFGKMLVRL